MYINLFIAIELVKGVGAFSAAGETNACEQ